MAPQGTYLKKLRTRAATSKIYRKYQLIGLEIAKILEDEKHKSLYIKLAKQNGASTVLRIAKDVAERRGVRNKGAYFMFVIHSRKKNADRHAR